MRRVDFFRWGLTTKTFQVESIFIVSTKTSRWGLTTKTFQVEFDIKSSFSHQRWGLTTKTFQVEFRCCFCCYLFTLGLDHKNISSRIIKSIKMTSNVLGLDHKNISSRIDPLLS